MYTNLKITIHFVTEKTNPTEMQKEGCQTILTNFKKYHKKQ
jgi:hypothetical protein